MPVTTIRAKLNATNDRMFERQLQKEFYATKTGTQIDHLKQMIVNMDRDRESIIM